jgi:TRAP-type C4-dicarboxylate transport system permease small subunit
VEDVMKRLMTLVYKLDLSFQVISGVVLAFMMLVTLADIIMRAFGKPIVGGIELICFAGAVAIGFALPYSSYKKAHIYVDFLLEKLSLRSRTTLQVITKCVGVLLFLFIGYNFVLYGFDLIKTGEVSAGLRLPYYPITFGLAVSCFLESLTLLCDVMKLINRGER